ncbi:hypothetical protein [Mesorhizobium ventifaucium]|uniref:hypothetical protein n=1 Tax=Mesorhizobium ventifaucium TaxID=666020 RepID=UPI0020A808F7|nr:hypothetical protein [Mesorhizobium ventifaucium]
MTTKVYTLGLTITMPKECGDALAAISYEHDGDTLPNKLKADLKKRVKFDKRSRIYVIYRHPNTGLNKGRFVVGTRKAAPWTGYSPDGDVTDEEE